MEHERKSLNPIEGGNLNFIRQMRQLSVPLWARLLALILAASTLMVGIVLIWQGWNTCAPDKCRELWLEQGVKVIGTTFLPVIVLVYLLFAETGVKALLRKSGELLRKTIPTALQKLPTSDVSDNFHELDACLVETFHSKDAPSARYRLTGRRHDQTAQMDVSVEVNVSKINVCFLIPCFDDRLGGVIAELEFGTSLKGALHEGYTVDASFPEVMVGAQRFVKVVARLRMNNDFLWDPAQKLHFAQDLRLFCHAMLSEGWSYLSQ